HMSPNRSVRRQKTGIALAARAYALISRGPKHSSLRRPRPVLPIRLPRCEGGGALFQHALLLHPLDGLVGQRLLAPGGGIAGAVPEQVEQWLEQGVLVCQRCLPSRTAIRVRQFKDVGFADDGFR